MGGLWIDSTVILSKRIYALSELFDRLFFRSVLREIVILMFPMKTGQLGSWVETLMNQFLFI